MNWDERKRMSKDKKWWKWGEEKIVGGVRRRSSQVTLQPSGVNPVTQAENTLVGIAMALCKMESWPKMRWSEKRAYIHEARRKSVNKACRVTACVQLHPIRCCADYGDCFAYVLDEEFLLCTKHSSYAKSMNGSKMLFSVAISHESFKTFPDDQHITRLGKIGEAVHSPGWSTKAILSLVLVIGSRWGVQLICLPQHLSYHSCGTKSMQNPRMSCSVRNMECLDSWNNWLD